MVGGLMPATQNPDALATSLERPDPSLLGRLGRTMLVAGSAAALVGGFLHEWWPLAALLVAGLGAVLARLPLHRLPGFWWGCAFLAWGLVSHATAYVQHLPGARLRPDLVVVLWMSAGLLGLGLSGDTVRRRATIALVAIALATVPLAAAQLMFGCSPDYGGDEGLIDWNAPAGRFARGLSQSHQTYGLAMCVLLALHAEPAATMAGRLRTWLGIATAGASLLFCGARSAVLAGAAAVWALFAARSRRWLVIGSVLAALVVAAALGRMALTGDNRLGATLSAKDGRYAIWRTGAELIRQRPIMGWGNGACFKASYHQAFVAANPPGTWDEFPEGVATPHNGFLTLLAHYGIPGLLLHSLFWLSVLRWLYRRRADSPAAWRLGLAITAIWLVGGQFQAYAGRQMQSVILHGGLGLAMAVAYARLRAASRQS